MNVLAWAFTEGYEGMPWVFPGGVKTEVLVMEGV